MVKASRNYGTTNHCSYKTEGSSTSYIYIYIFFWGVLPLPGQNVIKYTSTTSTKQPGSKTYPVVSWLICWVIIILKPRPAGVLIPSGKTYSPPCFLTCVFILESYTLSLGLPRAMGFGRAVSECMSYLVSYT